MRKTEWSKDNLIKIVQESKSQKEVLEKLNIRAAGGNFSTLRKYLNLFDIKTEHFKKNYEFIASLNKDKKIPLDKILIENSTYNRKNLKDRLYEEGLKIRKCEICGQDENWNGRHMSLILDHINGVYNDNRMENLRIVCPNCNATLDTHCRGKSMIEKIEEKIKQKQKNLINGFILRRKVNRPNYDILIEEVDKMGLEAVGRKYGVTGNAVKKWIITYKKYNI